MQSAQKFRYTTINSNNKLLNIAVL